MADTTKKFVMILEKSSHNLDVKSDGEEVVLEGIFAQFGVVNNNERIYEESEYLPHMEYLNKKIESKRLLGELDHPEKFDISLSKVSHIVEKLEYDKNTRQVRGRVRLLDTPSGRIAKELVKGGVPISISSRAAGLVESNKKVKIKKIFTYDLVADPGFENAVLSRINESLGIHNDFISVYEIGDELNSYLLDEENENIQKTNENMDFVTPKELHDYSLLVKKEIEKINETVDTLKETPLIEQIEKLSENVSKMEKYLEYLAGVSDKTIQYAEYVAEQVENVSDSVEKNIAYTEYVAEHLDNNIAYTGYIAEKTDQAIQYSEYIKENVENVIKFSDYLAEKVNNNIEHSEYLTERVNNGIEYSEYLAEKIDQSISYAEHIAEGTTESFETLEESISNVITYSDYLAEQLEKGISYTEYVAEQTQAVADYAEFAINESTKQEQTQEKIQTPQNTTVDYSTLSEQVDNLLKTVKKQKTEEVNESMKTGNAKLPDESIVYSFVSLLTESKREEFRNLDEADKKKVASALNGKTLTTEVEILNLWESALHPRSEKWIEEAPEKYKQTWESLDESQKRTLIAQSRSYKLDTDYQIKNFWETRSASLLTSKSQSLNESHEVKVPTLGYSEEYLKMIGNQLGKFNK